MTPQEVRWAHSSSRCLVYLVVYIPAIATTLVVIIAILHGIAAAGPVAHPLPLPAPVGP
jgi:hypothetical protein